MTRLIDADYVKEHMRASELNGRRLHIMELEERLAVIDEVPTVDAVPVRHGKWTIFDSQSDKVVDIKCSECKKGFAVDAYEWCDIGFTINDLHYCPNCGARMDEE